MSRAANFRGLAGFTPLDAVSTECRVVEVASTYATAIYVGDPVTAQTDGTVILTPAGTGQVAATDGITGVVVDIIQYKRADGVLTKQHSGFLPASTTWTAPGESSRLLIVPAYKGQRFKIRGLTAAASIVAARALKYANCEHSYATADSGLGLTGAQLVIAGAATTALQWRIVDIIDKPGNDPLLVNFEAVVMVNKSQAWPPLGDSTTGI